MVPYYSELITNAEMLPEDVAALGVKLQPGQVGLVAVLKVLRPSRGDWFLCCLCGGDTVLDRYHTGPLPGTHMATLDDGLEVGFTPMGLATFRGAAALLGPEGVVYFYGINCQVDHPELQRRINAAIALMPPRGLLVFLGDIGGACNGRILPKLNVSGHCEFRKESINGRQEYTH